MDNRGIVPIGAAQREGDCCLAQYEGCGRAHDKKHIVLEMAFGDERVPIAISIDDAKAMYEGLGVSLRRLNEGNKN